MHDSESYAPSKQRQHFANVYQHAAMVAVQVAGVFHGMLDKPLAQLLQAQQEKVMVWTIDDPADAERMLALGVDGIVTNAPALLSATVESVLLSCTKAVAPTRYVIASAQLGSSNNEACHISMCDLTVTIMQLVGCRVRACSLLVSSS